MKGERERKRSFFKESLKKISKFPYIQDTGLKCPRNFQLKSRKVSF